MSDHITFRKLEKQLSSQLAEQDTLREGSSSTKEAEFETKLHRLLDEYGFSLREILVVLDPQAVSSRISITEIAENEEARDPEKSGLGTSSDG